MGNIDLNECEKKVDAIAERLETVEENVKLLTHIFEEVIKQFELIQKEMKQNNKK